MMTGYKPYQSKSSGWWYAPLLAGFALTVIFSGVLSGDAQAAKLIKKIKDWAIYEHKKGDDRLCFITSRPKTMKPKNVVRGDVMFYVSTWPGQGVRNEVSVKIGYHFATDSQPEAKIDKTSFRMTVDKDRGYINSAEQELAFVGAMRRGVTMTVYGKSKRGTNTADTYSLSGVTAALNALKQLCK